MVFTALLRKSFKGVVHRRCFHVSAMSMVQVGETLPSIELMENEPGNKVNILELCKNKKVVIFAVPGAFTPGCSKTHLPGYVEKSSEIKTKGFDEIICISVNDPFVMNAWGESQNVQGKIRMLADADAKFTKSMNLHIDLPPLGGVRSKRYSMVVENGVITKLSVEPDGTGLTCSLAQKLEI